MYTCWLRFGFNKKTSHVTYSYAYNSDIQLVETHALRMLNMQSWPLFSSWADEHITDIAYSFK